MTQSTHASLIDLKPAPGRMEGDTRDAIVLLKADQREVAGWFEDYRRARGAHRKADLAGRICKALTVYATIEEEIFYPAFLEATQDKDMHHEAKVVHAGSKRLIAEIEASSPLDERFDAKVAVLSALIKHHVNDEEQPHGMFAQARDSEMDLVALGARMAVRKAEIIEGAHGRV